MQRATPTKESPATRWFLDQVASAALEDHPCEGQVALVERAGPEACSAP